MAFAQVVTHFAIAIPFLLLPSCRSLHVVEEGHGRRDTIIFGVHHKTGTLLAETASNCFDSTFKHQLLPHFTGAKIGPHTRMVHITRAPTSVVVSAYIYHKETGEAWTLKNGSAWEFLENEKYVKKFLGDRNESYTAFLRRVGALVGIRAEMFRMSLAQLVELNIAEKFCAGTSQCLQMCLEDFTVSSLSYDASWRKVLKFMGKNVTWEMHHCLSKDDLNRYPEDSAHITANIMPEWRYTKLKNIVEYMDATVFNSTFKHMGKARYFCGGDDSKLFNGFADSSGTDGGKFREWLIEEMYSSHR